MRSIYENWHGHIVKLTWMPAMKLDEITEMVTSVHAICIKNNKVLLSLIEHRGFNVPGGHINADEGIEEALHREVLEEAYVKGHLTYLGCIEVNHEENPNFDPHGKYPLIGYQAFYKLDITICLPFLREYESKSRIWVEPSEINYVINDHKLINEIIDTAVTINTKKINVTSVNQ